MIWNIISWCVFGLIAGALARLLLPGDDSLGCLGTIAVGVAGAFISGFIAHLLFGGSGDGFEPAGFIGAVVGGIILLAIVRQFRGSRAG